MDALQRLIETVKNGRDENLGYFGGRTVMGLHDDLTKIFKK